MREESNPHKGKVNRAATEEDSRFVTYYALVREVHQTLSIYSLLPPATAANRDLIFS